MLPDRPLTETERAMLLRAALDADRRFRLARDACDLAGMAAALNELETLSAAADQYDNENAGSIRTLRDTARSERAARCPTPPPAPPPPPPAERTEDVMQLPQRFEGPTYNVGFGGTYLSDGPLDLGLVGATFDVDLPLDGPEPSGLGQVRLGPRFRITGDVQTGLFDESHEAGAFSDSLGLQWSASAFAGIALPVGDRDPGNPGEGFALFAQAGYGFARFRFEASGPGFDFGDSRTSDFLTFRLGAEYNLDGRNSLRATYTRWDDFESDGISANLFGISYVRVLGQRP